MRISIIVLLVVLATVFLLLFRFDGVASLLSSSIEASSLVGEKTELESPYVWGQNKFIDLRIVGVPPTTGITSVSLTLITVGSVWLTYLYVIIQTLGIKKRAFELRPESRDSGAAPKWARILMLTAIMPVAGLADAWIVQFSGIDVFAGGVLLISLVVIEVLVFWEIMNRTLK